MQVIITTTTKRAMRKIMDHGVSALFSNWLVVVVVVVVVIVMIIMFYYKNQ